MSWIGGKKALRELIVTLFPVYYERYIEVFGGGGWVLFHKPPGNDFEVYNDFNSLLVNLYRCVRDKPQELMEALRYVLNSREDFDVVRATLARDSPASDVQKAAWFYELIRYSYAAGLTSFGSQPHDMWSNFPLIEQAHRRLAKVVIENKDFEKLIRQYDRPASLFYLDPPYHATEGYYQNIGEDGFTLELMRATVMVEGKPYVKLGGSIGRYPKFQPEDYVILRLEPRYQNGEWVRWMQEMPPGTPPELLKAAENFSNLKLGFRGDLKFWPEPEIIEVKALLAPEEIQSVNLSISM